MVLIRLHKVSCSTIGQEGACVATGNDIILSGIIIARDSGRQEMIVLIKKEIKN